MYLEDGVTTSDVATELARLGWKVERWRNGEFCSRGYWHKGVAGIYWLDKYLIRIEFFEKYDVPRISYAEYCYCGCGDRLERRDMEFRGEIPSPKRVADKWKLNFQSQVKTGHSEG